MEPNWNELNDGLKEGPFPQKGFTRQLQWQIEAKLAGQAIRYKARIFTFLSAGIVLLMVAFIIGINWTPLTETVAAIEDNAGQLKQMKTTEANNPILTQEPIPVKSVLLIGLRTDYHNKNEKRVLTENNYSEYRSLMITGESQFPYKLQIAAEGKGILVPYRQHFWKIEPITLETNHDTYHYLTAHPANENAVQRSYAETSNIELRHNEKLVFAGNQYVSIVEKDEEWRGNAPAHYEKIWTRTLDQMNSPTEKEANTISMQNIFGKQADETITQLQAQMEKPQVGIKAEISGKNWAITRNKGQWVPQIAQMLAFTNNHAISYTLHPIPYSLPESVVSYDQLSSSWDRIIEVQPEAVDAVSSPSGDMIAILTVDKLYVYSYSDNKIGSLALQVDLHENESLVMAQWATAKYASNWIEEGRRYLNN
jgi:hypothetical protein